MNDWDRDRDARDYAERTGDWGISYVLTRVLVVVAVLSVVGALAWGLKVLVAPAKGAGDAYQIQQDARNRIRAQEGFEVRYQDILAADRNIRVAADAKVAEPNNPNRQTEYVGLVQYCNQLVGEYNAKARSFRDEEFRAADLPREIDLTNADTDCKE